MVASGTRSIAPLIAGLLLSHLSYPAVASIQVQHCAHFLPDSLYVVITLMYIFLFQAVVLLIFTVGQVTIEFPF